MYQTDRLGTKPENDSDSSGNEHPTRVLLEVPDEAEAARLWQVLADRGYEVHWCPGPEGPPATWCPLLGAARCDLIESADVVVSALGLSLGSCREVLAKLRALHPEARVIVEAGPSEAARWPSLLNGYQVLQPPVSADALLAAVDLALHSR
jgi:DNA-binding response OmpR family regulator